MTWLKFKQQVEANGVKDEDEIDWIDATLFDVSELKVCRDSKNGRITITDVWP